MNIRFFKILTLCGLIVLANTSVQSAVTKLDFPGLKDLLISNANRPFTIRKAIYKSKISDKKKDVTSLLNLEASKGLLLLPKNLNTTFSDPALNEPKVLNILFTIPEKSNVYTFKLQENWYQSSTRPWFKEASNKYVRLEPSSAVSESENNAQNLSSSPWPPAGKITYDQLKTMLETNNNKPFKITKAGYGAPGAFFTVSNKLQAVANSGKLYIPKNMNAAFGDPIGGIAKNLDITFNMNQQEYQLTFAEYWFTSLSTPEWFKQPNQYLLLEQETQSQSDQNLSSSPLPEADAITIAASEPINQDQNLSSSPLPTADAITIDELKPILEKNKGKPFTITEALYGDLANPQNIKNVTQKFQNIADLGILYLPSGFIYLGDRYPESKQLRITFAMNQKNYSITINDNWTRPSWCITSPFIELSSSVSINFAQLKTLLIKNNKTPFKISLLRSWLINQGGAQVNEEFTGFNTLKENASRGLFLNPYTQKSYNNGAIEKFDIIFTMQNQEYIIMRLDQRQLTSEEQSFHDNYFIQYP